MNGPWAGRRLHFVGIGGRGMSGLAVMARAAGAHVTGSERTDTERLPWVREQGIDVHIGQDAALVPADAEVVYSTAIPEQNPERRDPELSRGELLGQLAAVRRCIAVAGSHGKTTTAAMIVHALRGAGMDPGYVVGAPLRATGRSAEWGDGDWLVAETDESDRSLLSVRPQIAVITAVSHEHVLTYPTRADVDAVFAEFAAGADEVAGWQPPDARLEAGRSAFTWRGIEVEVGVPGDHNARNAAAALEACALTGADLASCAASLASFPGAARRFEHMGTTSSGAQVYDDYACHPLEVRATLTAARTMGPRRLVAMLQPWSAVRVERMAEEFRDAMTLADSMIVTEYFSSRATPREFAHVTAKVLVNGAENTAFATGGVAEAERRLAEELREGDLCVVFCPSDSGLAKRLVQT